jgi:hypothetical protein
VVLSTLTNAVDLSDYRKLLRYNVLVLHRANGAAEDSPSQLYELWGKVSNHHTGVQHFCSVHKQSLRTHTNGGKIFKITRRTLLRAVRSMGWQPHALWQLRILWDTAKRSGLPRGRR